MASRFLAEPRKQIQRSAEMDLGDSHPVNFMPDSNRTHSMALLQIVSHTFSFDKPDCPASDRTDNPRILADTSPTHVRHMPRHTYEGHRDAGNSTLGSPHDNFTHVSPTGIRNVLQHHRHQRSRRRIHRNLRQRSRRCDRRRILHVLPDR